jgi:hypothetical protein
MVCWSCFREADKKSTLNEADVKELIGKFGPVLYMHPNEEYRLRNPEDILNRAWLCVQAFHNWEGLR